MLTSEKRKAEYKTDSIVRSNFEKLICIYFVHREIFKKKVN